MPLPVFICHVGKTDHLQGAFIQAEHTLGRKRVIVIGDEECRAFWKGPFISLEDVSSYALEFDQSYKHLSGNFESYERFCFYRWFFILAVMESMGLDQCIAMDSDFLVFEDFNYLEKLEPDKEFIGDSYFAYIRSRSILSDLCQYYLEVFRSPEKLSAAAKKHRDVSPSGDEIPYISDMSLLRDFYELFPDRTYRLNQSEHSGYVGCMKVYEHPEYLVKNDSLMIVWKNDRAYLADKNGNPATPVRGAHFLHSSKNMIPECIYPGLRGKLN